MIDEGFICLKLIQGATCKVREFNAFLLFRNQNHREINYIFVEFICMWEIAIVDKRNQLSCAGVKQANSYNQAPALEYRCSAYEYIYSPRNTIKTMVKKKKKKKMFE